MIPDDWMKVVTAKEMARVEKISYEEGSDEETFMQEAGKKVALQTAGWIHQHHRAKSVILLVGKGNNGGDAFVAGTHLLQHSYSVQAFCFFSLQDCSPLCQKMAQQFENAGGKITFLTSSKELQVDPESTYLDGLLGTGFKGELKSPLLDIVHILQKEKAHVISIDIPSGIDGNTGQCSPNAIQANLTILLGLPKAGSFLNAGYEKLGEFVIEDFGLPQKYIDQAETFAHLIKEDVFSRLLPKVVKTRHKYEAGLVVGVAGSKGMGGAAKLSAMATLRAGAGITRLFYPKEMEEEMQNAPHELIRIPWENPDNLIEQCNKAKAVFLGPGLGRTGEVADLLQKILPHIEVPTVIDADGLFFFAEHLDVSLPERIILTPHKKEMLRLLHKESLPEEEFLRACREFAHEKKVCLVVKGAPTWLFFENQIPIVLPYGDPGMATAGTGDVLTGIVAGLLAQGVALYDAAALGVYVHALSGKLASKEKTSYSVIATDLLDFLPHAYKFLESSSE